MEIDLLAKNLILIVVVFAVAFLSQQPAFNYVGKNIYPIIQEQMNVYWQNTLHWLGLNIYSKVAPEVTKRGVDIKNQAINQRNNFLQTIWENIKNYFANQFSKTF